MSDESPQSRTGLSRRRLMQGAAAVGVAAWIPFEQIPAARPRCRRPVVPQRDPAVPAVLQELVRRHRGRRRLDVYGAHAGGRRSRWPTGRAATAGGSAPRAARTTGRRSRWPDGSDAANVVLVDTKTNLTRSPSTRPRRGCGCRPAPRCWRCSRPSRQGPRRHRHPAPGDLTVGGVLAIDGHGTAVPKTGETKPAGHTYGSISNLVQQLTAVVWDSATSSYVLRTYPRRHPRPAR